MEDGSEQPTDVGFFGGQLVLSFLGLRFRCHGLLSAVGRHSFRLWTLPHREE
jgi:hypothetical protein